MRSYSLHIGRLSCIYPGENDPPADHEEVVQMKKVVIAVLVVGLLSIAGTAMAKNNRGQKGVFPPNGACPQTYREGGPAWAGECPVFSGRNGMHRPGHGRGHQVHGRNGRGYRGHGWDGRMGWNAVDMPEALRAKAVEMEKLHVDLRDVLSRTPIDRDKALELHGKIVQIHQEIGAWRFAQRLEAIDSFRRQQELNRAVPPGQPAAPDKANPAKP